MSPWDENVLAVATHWLCRGLFIPGKVAHWKQFVDWFVNHKWRYLGWQCTLFFETKAKWVRVQTMWLIAFCADRWRSKAAAVALLSGCSYHASCVDGVRAATKSYTFSNFKGLSSTRSETDMTNTSGIISRSYNLTYICISARALLCTLCVWVSVEERNWNLWRHQACRSRSNQRIFWSKPL